MRDTYLVPLEELCTALYGTYQQNPVHRGTTADTTFENDDQVHAISVKQYVLV
jgi:hypothetical protein